MVIWLQALELGLMRSYLQDTWCPSEENWQVQQNVKSEARTDRGTKDFLLGSHGWSLRKQLRNLGTESHPPSSLVLHLRVHVSSFN